MALYQNAESPGDWRSFLKRNDVRNLTLTEQKSKYQKEQLLFEDFIAQQAYLQQMSLHALNQNLHQGGNLDNKVESIAFAGTVTTISGFTSYVDVTFNDAVSIKAGGVPFIAITNGKEGNGTGSPINYIYSSGVDSKVLRFASSQVAGNNLGAVAANVLGASKVLSLAGVSEPLDADPGTFANVTYTNGASSGITSTFDVTIGSLGFLSEVVDDLLTSFTTNPTNCAAKTTTGVTFATIGSGINGVATVVTTGTTAPTITGITITTPGSGYVVGEQLTIATGALGTGQLITTDNLLSQTTTAGIGNVTGPFTLAISSTSATGSGGTIQLQGDGANALIGSVSRTIGTGYVNGEVLTISNADLLAAGFAGATGDVVITLQASNVQDSNAAIITLDASDFVTGITAVTSGIAGNGWVPGDEIIFDNAQFGATSTGGSILIQAGDLTGDTLILSGSIINENGSEIYSRGNRSTDQLDLSYTSNSTLTAVAT